MTLNLRYAQLLCLFLTFLAVLAMTGCCSRKADRSHRPRRDLTKTPAENRDISVSSTAADPSVNKAGSAVTPAVSAADKLSSSLYRRLDYSFEMFRRDNMDGALREVERLQLEINNDPYLEMQSWYLSAMIYHKTGKASRRKRSMRKMLETMEQLQKDPRFKKSFQDGIESQDLINMALKKGEGKYADY